jgi:hypothetical protein
MFLLVQVLEKKAIEIGVVCNKLMVSSLDQGNALSWILNPTVCAFLDNRWIV